MFHAASLTAFNGRHSICHNFPAFASLVFNSGSCDMLVTGSTMFLVFQDLHQVGDAYLHLLKLGYRLGV